MAASPGCWQRYGESLAAQYQDRAWIAFHQLLVDAYAVQHPDSDDPRAIPIDGDSSQLAALHDTIPHSTFELIDGLTHNAPDEIAPTRVAEHLEAFLAGQSSGEPMSIAR